MQTGPPGLKIGGMTTPPDTEYLDAAARRAAAWADFYAQPDYSAEPEPPTPAGARSAAAQLARLVGEVLAGMRPVQQLGSLLDEPNKAHLVRWLGRGDEQLGWQLTRGAYGVVAVACFLAVFLSTRERIEPPPQQSSTMRQDVSDLLHNRPWLVLFALALIIMVTIVMRSGSLVYFLKYHVERPELTGAFLGSYSIALAIGAASTPLLTRFADKKRLLAWLMAGVGVLSCAMYFVPRDAIGALLVLNFAIGLLLGPKSPLAFSMYADCADYTEWKSGRRATAMSFAAATVSQKLGGALASALIAWGLAAMGYVANQAQSDASRLGIVLLLTVVPGVVALLAAWVMRFYPLDDPALARIQSDLRARREAAA